MSPVALAFVAWVSALAFLDDGLRRPAVISLDAPPRDGAIERPAGESLGVHTSGVSRDKCLLVSGGDSLLLGSGEATATVSLSPVPGEQLVWFETVCAETLGDRFARYASLSHGSSADRTEVLRLHMNSDQLERWLSGFLPAALNEQMPRMVDAGRNWVESILPATLDQRSYVTLSRTRVAVEGSRVVLRFDADVSVRVHLKGLRAVGFTLSDRLVQAGGYLELRGWPNVVLGGLHLPAGPCDVGRLFNELCRDIKQALYSFLTPLIERAGSREVTRFLSEIDPNELVGNAIVDWAEEVGLVSQIGNLVDGADFSFARGVNRFDTDGGLSFSISARSDWLGASVADTIALPRTGAPIQVALSAPAINRALDAAFDRDLASVLRELERFAQAAGFDDELSALRARVDSAATPPREVAGFLRATELKFADGLAIQPRLNVGEDGRVRVLVLPFKLFEGKGTSDGVLIDAAAEVAVTPRRLDSALSVSPDMQYLASHIAFEPYGRDPTGLDPLLHVRFGALSRFALEQIGIAYGLIDKEPLIGNDAMTALTSVVPSIPARFQVGGLEFVGLDFKGEPWSQAIIVEGEIGR